LKSRLINSEREKADEIERLNILKETAVAEVKQENRKQIEVILNEKENRLREFENEIVKQRERTLKLIEEKDNELATLREVNNEHHFVHNSNKENRINKPTSSLTDSNDDTQSNGSNELNTNVQLFNQQINTETNHLVHFSQQNAYKDIELNKLRKAKTDLEYKLKQTMDENSVDVDRLQAQINLLKQEIERIKLNDKRVELNGNNMEYVKNVVYNYLTTKDDQVKMNMIKAITQILQFSKSEKQKIQTIYVA
jgi:GRIP and coiled-coil domain-containing protein 1